MRSLDFKLQNLKNAYKKLCEVCEKYDGTDDIVRDSMIQRFEFTYELSHKVLREFMRFMGIELDNTFPRTVFKKAYVNDIIDDDKLWMRLMQDRNHTSHIYNESMSEDIAARIKNEYVKAIGTLIERIELNME
ncbi:MAG: HI0074 family nucleotidyltransferase substrate-binding subunit [Candidatus Ornithomonoglobus sp.]